MSFRGYEVTLVLAQQVQHSTFLFTIGVSDTGLVFTSSTKHWFNLSKSYRSFDYLNMTCVQEDEPGCNPTIKVWNLAKPDKQGNPTCVRISRAVPSYRAVPATALCVHSSLTLMAIGFGDGSIMLYR